MTDDDLVSGPIGCILRDIPTSARRLTPYLTDGEESLVLDLLDGEVKGNTALSREAWYLINDLFEGRKRAGLGVQVLIANMSKPSMRDSLPMRLDVVPNRKRNTAGRSRDIAVYFASWLSEGRQRALIETMTKFGASDSTVEKAYAAWKPSLKMRVLAEAVKNQAAENAVKKAPAKNAVKKRRS